MCVCINSYLGFAHKIHPKLSRRDSKYINWCYKWYTEWSRTREIKFWINKCGMYKDQFMAKVDSDIFTLLEWWINLLTFWFRCEYLKAQDSLGMAMIFTLSSLLKDLLTALVVERKERTIKEEENRILKEIEVIIKSPLLLSHILA